MQRRPGWPISSGWARASSRRAFPTRPRTPGRSSSTKRCSRMRRRSRAAATSTASSCRRSSVPPSARPRGGRGRLPCDRGVAGVRAGRRPLRQPVLRRRASAGGRGRARGAPPAHVVPALDEPHRLGRARDREHAVRRAARRGRARRRARVGARLSYSPRNSGLRFSVNASTPSRKSWVCWRRP